MKNRVLIVDDSIYMRLTIKTALEKAGYEVVGEAANGESAIEMALDLKPDLITLDNVLPDMFGKELLKILTEEELETHILMVSAVGQDSVVKEELSLGAMDYIVKPFDEDQLINAVNNIMHHEV
ncbi:MAG: response regulator [Ekhidna sp.]